MPESIRRFTVTELNAEIRSILEGSFSDIWVRGEISNFHNHPSSGHMYFTLKDGQA
ncbi:MAG TPA: exodeoxyribonuclease VII large subunit, partial [Candidatus Marinimicrobia bacterium]|nr:exodeoxyribonuclease VII large subunit [Candidatus Neomarinimicrobiota bacterium]